MKKIDRAIITINNELARIHCIEAEGVATAFVPGGMLGICDRHGKLIIKLVKELKVADRFATITYENL